MQSNKIVTPTKPISFIGRKPNMSRLFSKDYIG